ncbi:MAG: peptidoglycan DD-metalloendopeptidase family protein [Rhodosalinus sp.]
MRVPARTGVRVLSGTAALLALTACTEPVDFDLRPSDITTAEAASRAVADRPEPDRRGVISYPNYQVAVARRDDTLGDVAARVDLPAGELARYNGVQPDTLLRQGEIIALPRRVSEPAGAEPAATDRRGELDVAALAGPAIDGAAPSPVETQPLPAAEPAPSRPASEPEDEEPIRHQVERGETAYSIARLYDVSVRSLAEWNGLGPDFGVRDGQHLLIPVAQEPPRRAAAETERETPPPGTGSPTPPPPSATQPLPEDDATPAAEPAPAPPSPELGREQTEADTAPLSMPVDGPIIREFARGRNNGIAIAADPGTPVRAAAAGQVAAVTETTDEVSIVVIKHEDNLLSVYVNLQDIEVARGDRVSRGDRIAAVAPGSPSFLHFEVTRGTERVDPMPLLNP